MEHKYGDALEPIAVVGMACRFAGEASSIENLWEMMKNGRHAASAVPEERFNADAWYHPSPERKGAINTKRGFFLKEDITLFDAPFFSMAGKEVLGMDPMQRQLLAVAYESFENAGMPLKDLIGSNTAVYTGVMTNDYELISASDPYNLPLNSASGTGRAMLSNRLSWFFDLRGPSLTLDTACSSSLYALHLACQALRQKEASQALVTGVNLILHPCLMSQLSSMHMLSNDGTSHSFDSSASGYGRGEGVAGIIIKPLHSALADGDTIRAIIRGSGINQDGKTPGITMPSEQAQAALINSTYTAAGLGFEATSYFEAHGTGTALGDPVELRAVAATIGHARKSQPTNLYIGSVKTNIGHTEGVAGLAGVIKTILCLEKGALTPVVGFKTLNPKLHLSEWHMALPLETMAWPTQGLRRASVNSFGFGGSNAHIILDDALHYLQSRGLSGNHETVGAIHSCDRPAPPAALANGHTSHKQLFVFSSPDKAGLQRIAESYMKYPPPENVRLDFLSYTLSCRRTHFDHRSFVVSDSQPDLLKSLAYELPTFPRVSGLGNVALVFTGQGAQWIGMGRELTSNMVYRSSVLKSQGYLRSFGCDWDILDMLSGTCVPSFDRPLFSQPLCTILQIALVDMLFAWGLVPTAVVGHSSGEIVAAYAAGAITQHDAVKVAYYRGFYSEDIPRRLKNFEGAMMAAGISEEEARSYLDREISQNEVVIGCINSPSSVTFSGERKAIEHLELILQRDGKFARRLRVDVAYHSPQMQVVSSDFLHSIGKIATKSTFRCPMFSSVTTQKISHPQDLSASYWVKNMLGSVKFAGAVKNMICGLATHQNGGISILKREQLAALVEIGPSKTLKGPLDQILAAVDPELSQKVVYTSILQYGKNAMTTALEAAGHLWCSGCLIDLGKVNSEGEGELKPSQALTMLPPYPWNHKTKFWHESEANRSARLKRQPRTDLLGIPYDNQNPFEPQWRNFLGVTENPWIKDHIITGTCLYPGAGIIIMVLEAACQMVDPSTITGVEFQDVFFERGLVIPAEGSALEVSLNIRPHETISSRYYFTVYSMPGGGGWTKNAYGIFSHIPHSANGVDSAAVQTEWEVLKSEHHDLSQLPAKPVKTASFYEGLKSTGLEYGPLFTNLDNILSFDCAQSASGSVRIPNTRSSMPYEFEYPNYIHPATLDAMFHLVYVALSRGQDMEEASIPVQIDYAFISTSLPCGAGATYAGISHSTSTKDRISADLIFSDEEWTGPKVQFRGIQLRNVSSQMANNSETLSPTLERKQVSRTAQMHWLEDVDFFEGPLAASHIQAEACTACPEAGIQNTVEACAAWLRRLCHKHADLDVLVMGAANKVEILQRFAPNHDDDCGTFRFKSCTVFDPCEKDLDQVKQALERGGITCRYSKSISSDAPSSYHLIISDIGTIDLEDGTLSMLRSFLRKDGRLACLGRRSRLKSCMQLSETKLINAGFSGFSLQVHNTENAFLVTQTNEKSEKTFDIVEVYLLQPDVISNATQNLISNLQEQLKLVDLAAKVVLLEQVSALKDQTVISLLEIEQPFVMDWTADKLDHFRTLVTSAKYVLWVSRGNSSNADLNSLQFAPTTGLLRTIRVEQSNTILPHLDLSRDLGPQHAASLIHNVLKSTFNTASSSRSNEMEYVERAGDLLIPRLTKSSFLDRFLAMPPPSAGKVDYPNGHDLKDNSQSNFGLDAADMELIEDIEQDDIIIRPVFAAVDVGGRQISSHHAGLDAIVGTVTKLGSMASGLQLGQSVLAFHSMVAKKQIKVQESHLCALPSTFSAPFVAYVSLSIATAWHVLFHVTRLKRGDRILIYVASNPLVYFLVKLAQQHFGADVFLVVSSDKEQRLWQSMGDMAPRCIVDAGSSTLGQRILRATGDVGVKFVITTYHGMVLNHLASCIAEDGHLVDLGGNIQLTDFPRTFFQQNVNVSCVDLRRIEAGTLCGLLTEALQHMDTELLHGLPEPEIKHIAEFDELLADVRSEGQSNTLVFSLEDPAVFTSHSSEPAAARLNPRGTYILSGGLGALGLSIADHLVSYGARHLLFLSRSGPSSSLQKAALQTLRERGCKIDSLNCDIADGDQVEKVAMTCREKCWHITGVIQCAMVLQDSIFENMTIEKWRYATNPKIKGSWNLHLHIPSEHLEFFITLSSMSAIIGNSAQANYCAGNSYEDALAHYRHSLGLPATTLNVGLVTDTSHFHSEHTIENHLKKFGHLAPISVTLDELLICLEAILTRQTAIGQPIPPQLLVGVSDQIPRHRDLGPLWSNDRKFDHRIQETKQDEKELELDTETCLRASKSVSQALAVVEGSLRKRVAASITGLPEDIDVDKPLYAFGFDSLKAMEARNWIQRELKCGISVFDIMSPMPLKELALHIVTKSPFTPTIIAKQVKVYSS